MTARELYKMDFDLLSKDHKFLEAIHRYLAQMIFRFQNVTDKHVQLFKELLEEELSDRFFGGCEVTFCDEEAYNFWNNLNINYFEYRETKVLSRATSEWHLKEEYKIPKQIFEIY